MNRSGKAAADGGLTGVAFDPACWMLCHLSESVPRSRREHFPPAGAKTPRFLDATVLDPRIDRRADELHEECWVPAEHMVVVEGLGSGGARKILSVDIVPVGRGCGRDVSGGCHPIGLSTEPHPSDPHVVPREMGAAHEEEIDVSTREDHFSIIDLIESSCQLLLHKVDDLHERCAAREAAVRDVSDVLCDCGPRKLQQATEGTNHLAASQRERLIEVIGRDTGRLGRHPVDKVHGAKSATVARDRAVTSGDERRYH